MLSQSEQYFSSLGIHLLDCWNLFDRVYFSKVFAHVLPTEHVKLNYLVLYLGKSAETCDRPCWLALKVDMQK